MPDTRLEIVLTARDITGRAFNRVRAGITNLRKSIFSLRGATVALGGVGGFAFLTKKALESADAIGKAADVAGIGTGALQEYQHAAQLSGVSTELLNNSFLAFNKRLGELRQGTGSLNSFLRKFDEALLDAVQSSKSTEQALDLIFRRMGSLENASDRAALAAAAFSRSGVKLINVVKDGAEGLDGMRAEARRLGLVIDDNLIRNSEAANDALDKLQRTITVNITKALVSLAPRIIEVTNQVLEWIETNQTFISQDIPKHLADIGRAALSLVETFQTLDEWADRVFGGKVDVSRQTLIGNQIKLLEKFEIRLKELESSRTPGRERLIEATKNKIAEIRQEIELMQEAAIEAALIREFHEIDQAAKTVNATLEKTNEQLDKIKTEAPSPVASYLPFPEALPLPRIPEPPAIEFEEIEQMSAAAFDSMDSHVDAYYDHLEQRQEAARELWDASTGSMQQAFAGFITSGKTDFDGLISSMLDSLARLAASRLFESLFTGLFTGPGALLPVGGGSGGGGLFNFGFQHGGYIGERVVGLGTRSGASYEFHPNEFVTPAGQAGGRVIINNYTGQPASQREVVGPGGRRDLEIMIGDMIQQGAGPVDSALRGAYNVTRRGRIV